MLILIGQYKLCTAFQDELFLFFFSVYISLHLIIVYTYTVIHSWVGWWVLVYFTGMNVFGSFSSWKNALCASRAVNMHIFVRKSLCTTCKFLFTHSNVQWTHCGNWNTAKVICNYRKNYKRKWILQVLIKWFYFFNERG